MSIAAHELPQASTELIIREVQMDMLQVVDQAPVLPNSGIAHYYAGDNPTVSIERQSEGVVIRVDSVPNALIKATDVMSLVVYFEHTDDGGLAPLPLHDDRCIRLIDRGRHHRPTQWPDGGYSFEPELEQGSLPHDRVELLAQLAGQVVATQLVSIKH